MENFNLKPNQALLIQTENQSSDSTFSAKTGNGRGTSQGRRAEEYLARRRKPKGDINIFDLGEYLVDGVWIDDTRQVIPTVEDLNAAAGSAEPPGYQSLLSAQYNKPLSVALSEWKTTFRKIDYDSAENYRLQLAFVESSELINVRNQNWKKPGALKSPGSPFVRYDSATQKIDMSLFVPIYRPFDTGVLSSSGQIGNNGLFQFINPANSDLKITATPDADADAVEFDLQPGGFDIYLQRQIYSQFASRISSETALTEGLNYFYSAIPKSIFTNEAQNPERTNPNDPAFLVDIIKILESLPSSRKFQVDSTSGELTPDGTGADFYIDSPEYTYQMSVNGIDARVGIDAPRALQGAINQKGNWFFFFNVRA